MTLKEPCKLRHSCHQLRWEVFPAFLLLALSPRQYRVNEVEMETEMHELIGRDAPCFGQLREELYVDALPRG